MHNVSRPVNRERKSSKRVVYLRATGKDPNSVKRYCLATAEIGVRAHCYEESLARGGGFQWTVLITAASVYGGETGNPSSPRFGLEHRMYDATMCCIIITMRGP